MTAPEPIRCLICHGPLQPGPRILGSLPDFPGDGPSSSGQTLSYVPVLGCGPFAHCDGCGATYSIKFHAVWGKGWAHVQ